MSLDSPPSLSSHLIFPLMIDYSQTGNAFFLIYDAMEASVVQDTIFSLHIMLSQFFKFVGGRWETHRKA